MPMTPHKDESQSDFMKRCVSEMMGDGKRPQEQAVAACLNIWREAHKDFGVDLAKEVASWKAKLIRLGVLKDNGDDFDPDDLADEVDPPEDDESRDDFFERCSSDLSDAHDDLDDDTIDQVCQIAWENRSARQEPIQHKTNAAAEISGLEFCLSDETEDRMGDVIQSDGWQLDNFKKNPIALFNHRSDFVIGTWDNISVKDKRLRGHLKMAPEGTSDRIDEIRRLIDAGILRAVSVGFKPLEYEPRRIDGKYVGELFTKQELVETSLVSVPANPNALAIAKSLKISATTIDLVFAESGNDKTEKKAGSGHGESARTTHSKGQTMSLSQRIVDQQNHLVALRDKLAAHLKDVDDTNVTDAELEVTNELNAKIAQAEKALASLKEAEKRLALADGGGDGGGGDRDQHQQQRQELMNGGGKRGKKKEIAPHEYVIRAGVCSAFAHRYKRSLQECRQIIYGDDENTKTYIEYIEKAASAPAMTTVSGWAQELAQTIYSDFMALLYPKSVYPRLSARGLALAFGRAGRIIVPTRNRTPTIAGSFVGEGQPIPVRQAQFASQTLVPKKMAVITTWTREIDEHSVPAIEGLLREAVTEDTAVSLDSVLLDANPATAVRPAGLLNGVASLTPTAGGGFNALLGDLKLIPGAILTATLGHVRSPVWLMNPQQLLSIRLTPSPLGEFPFAAEIAAGNLLGYPVVDSGTVPLGTVIMVDAADFVAVGGEAPRFEISDQATLHMEDTTPLPLVDGGTPAAPMRSLWQTDSLGLRLILPTNWTMRRAGMVAYIAGVTW